ncbi:hypothetical protein [Edaphocola aurantiacus]|uniref:hypothetical protein n=1 Tax=Edaphocola aurantiacus TaxID=2601682 RepID=UPI001C96A935|nr:hypothetical protein [Edaphocola aurantiacus]
MSSISFSNTRSADKRLYTADDTPANSGWCACFLIAPAKETLTITETWKSNNNAVYLYAANAPASEADFIKQLTAYLKSFGYDNAFLWFNDTGNITAQTVNAILATITLTGQVFTQTANILFGKYINLSISVNCLVRLDSSGQFFTISQGTITFSNKVATSSSQILNKQIYLSMTGASLGCIRFGLNFNGATDWQAYNTGLQYFYNSGSIQNISFPLLSKNYLPQIPFQASLDPVNQLNTDNRQRTFLAFNSGNTIFPTGLNTSLGNALYIQPRIGFTPNTDKLPFDIPLPDTALLVFSKSDKANVNSNYMLMQGGFHICTTDAKPPATNPPVNLLCGLSGIETILCNPQTATYPGDLLFFTINQPAYAPLFPIQDGQDTAGQPLLTNDYVTAWTSIVPFTSGTAVDSNNVAISYQSQPEGSSLYGAGAISTKTSTPLLGFYAPVTAYLQQANKYTSFPMAFYGSFDKGLINGADIAQFENKIINPWRKKTIETAALPQLIANHQKRKQLKTVPGKPSTTPQGLMVYVDEGSQRWTDLILAKNYKGTDPNPKPENVLTMDFTDLNPRLQSAFQTNQQFLVISFNKPLPESPAEGILGNFNNTIQLEGWPFMLNVPEANTYGQYNNVLIFKFCSGTVMDRVQNPALWTNSNDFNETGQNELSTLSDWLTAYVQDGVNRGKDKVNPDPDFVNFAKIATDPDWNGILALKTDISLSNFPEALQGLLAGIDLSKFNAHHFGINANHVSATINDTTKLVDITMDNRSSMFCLIYYVDPAFAPYTNDINAYKQTLDFNPVSNFDFKTLMLKVLFENSKIKSFKSYIQLSIYELFGSPTKQTPGRDNILILSGSYEDHNGAPSYTFNGFDDDLIPVDNPVFGAVEVSRSNFSTLTPTLISQQEKLVFAQFSLWGYINFSNPSGMDVLSFGSPGTPAKAQEGLAYSQLLINMNFSLDTPAIKKFEFNISQITFDIPSSLPRRTSLYNHFPIKLTGMVSGDADNLPAKLNFIPIATPDVSSSGIPSGKWYGLIYDLNLGTPGALAGSAGFKSSMMIAWSVSDGTIFTGIKLPGLSSQSKLLSLQGVLKLDIGTIKLLMAKTDDSANATTAFLLMMNNITLKFLSKTFPSGGNIDFYLFGDPDTTTQPSSLGWYGAYQKKS